MKKIIQIITVAAALLAAASCTSKSSNGNAPVTVKYEVTFSGDHTVNVEYAATDGQDLHVTTVKGNFYLRFPVYDDFPAYIHARKDPSDKEDVNITLRIYKNDEAASSITGLNEAVLSENICNCP